MSEERPDYATKEDFVELRAELFGNTPRRFETDMGRIGLLEKAVAELPALVKAEIKNIFSDWKARVLFGIAIGTFIIVTYGVLHR